MFIQTEETPNPSTLKFIPGRIIMEDGTIDFKTAEEALKSPLAHKLFEIEGVRGIFFGSNFITVSKENTQDWALLKPFILGTLMEFFLTQQPLFYREESSHPSQEDKDPIVMQIREIIDTRIRPAVAMDGGDIIFNHFEDGIVYVHMQGACSGCPSSSVTLKSGIENMLRHYVPEVLEVRAIEN